MSVTQIIESQITIADMSGDSLLNVLDIIAFVKMIMNP